MPSRIIREEFLTSEAVNQLTADEECFFVRLMLKADDYGRYSANLKLLKSGLYPLKDDVRDADIARKLAAAEQAGVVRCYEVDGKRYLEIPKFKQRARSPSKYPEPPDTCQSNDGQMTVKCQTNDGLGVVVVGDVVEGVGASGACRDSFTERPGESEVIAHADFIGLGEWKARDWWQEMESCGWLDYNKRPIANWRAAMARVRTKWEADGRPSGPPTRKENAQNASNRDTGRPGTDRNANTANAGRKSQYAGVGKVV